MKKVFTLLTAVLVALSASAVDFYLIGGFNNWTLKQANCKFTDQGDGTYVLDYKGTLTSGFKINDGTWGATYNYGAQNGAKLTVGLPFTVWANSNSGNIATSDDSSISNPHIVFTPAQNTLLITGQQQQAEVIYGIHSDWYSTSWSTTNLTKESDNVWVLSEREIPAGTFGIKSMDKATGSQLSWIAANGSSTVVANQAMSCKVDGTNFTNPAGKFKVIFDVKAMTVTFQGTQTGGDAKPDYSSWYVNIIGPFNGWEDNGVNPVNGISTTTDLNIGTEGFKVKIWNGEDLYYIAQENPIATDTWVQLYKDELDGEPVKIAGAAANSVYTVQYNVETNQVYCKLTSGGNVDPEPTPVITLNSVAAQAEQTTATITAKLTAENVDGNVTVYATGASHDVVSAVATDGVAVINLTGLTANTEYTYTVYAAAGDVKSAEQTVTFTTKAAAVEPDPELGETIDVTFDFTTFESLRSYNSSLPASETWPADPSSSVNKKLYNFGTLKNGGVNMTENGASLYLITSSGKYDLRMAAQNTITLSVPEGYKFDELVFTCTALNTNINKMTCSTQGEYTFVNNSSAKTMTWTAAEGTELGSLTFSCTGSTRIGTIAVKASKTAGTDEPEISYIYLVGTGEGLTWDLPGQEVEGKDKVYTFSVTGLTKFKFAAAKTTDWDGDNGFNEFAYNTVEPFGDAVAEDGGQTLELTVSNADILMPWTGDYTITVDLNNMTMTACTTTPKPTTAPDVYIRGDMNDWGTTWHMDYNAEAGNYTFVVDQAKAIQVGKAFKFADADWGSVNFGYGAVTLEGKETTVDLVYNADNITLNTEFVGTITLTVNGANAVAVFTSDIEVKPSYPETMYILGNLQITGGEWTSDKGVAMNPTENEGEFMADEVEFVGAMGTQTAYFSFTVSLAADWDNLGTRYGAESKDVPVEIGDTKPVAITGENHSFAIPAGKYKIVLSLADMTVTIDKPSGVEGVAVDAQDAAEYYNLQGVRVANPENGFYIVRRGNTVTKQYVK